VENMTKSTHPQGSMTAPSGSAYGGNNVSDVNYNIRGFFEGGI